MVAILLGADNGFFYAGQIMHFSSPFTVFLIYHKHLVVFITMLYAVSKLKKDNPIEAIRMENL